MWLANQTRPDFLNAVRTVARCSHAPKLVHWQAALHVLMYVRLTGGYGITFQRGTARDLGFEVYVDSDYASRATDRKSVSGGVVMCAGGCVSFFSRTQKCGSVLDGGGVCCDGRGVERGDFLALHLEFYLSGW